MPESVVQRFRKRGFAPSLALRLTALYTLVSCAIVVTSLGFLYRELVSDLDREDDLLLRQSAMLLDAVLLQPAADASKVVLDLYRKRSELGGNLLMFRIVDDSGAIVLEGAPMPAGFTVTDFPVATDPGDPACSGRDLQAGGRAFRALSATLSATVLGGAGACVQLALDRGTEHDLRSHYRTLLVLLAAFALPGCALAGYALARRAIHPVHDMANAVARVQAISLDERLRTDALPLELRPLGDAFNGLLERLSESFRKVGLFAANVAHELRTPIHVLRGEIEVALAKPPDLGLYSEVLRSCAEEAEEVTRIVDGLLFLAHAQLPGARIEMQRLVVFDEITTIVEYYGPLAEESGITISVAAAQDLVLDADRTLLRRALGNLLSNAIGFTDPGGTIRIAAATVGGRVEIVVTDSGGDCSREREPSPASTPGRAGLGLGLAIVRSVMELHGGEFTLERDASAGARVTLRFP